MLARGVLASAIERRSSVPRADASAERRELAEAIDRDRAFARCMRAKGYRWPDPIPDEGGFRTDEIEAAGIDPDDPRLQAHERDCLGRAGQPVTP